MINIITLITIVLLIFIAFYIIELSLKNKYIILYITFAVFYVTTFEWITDQTIRFSLGIIDVNTLDILAIYLVVMVFFYNFKKIEKDEYDKTIKYSLYFALLIFLISFMRGLVTNSFSSVLEDVRRLIVSFFIPIICYTKIPIDLEDEKTKKIISFFVKSIVIYCCICWILDLGLGIQIMRAQSDAGTTMRVLRAEQTVIIAMVAVYSVYNDLISSAKRYISINSFILIGVVILLQHRSVWIALGVGLFYIIITCFTVKVEGLENRVFSIEFVLQMCLIIVLIPLMYFIFKDSKLFSSLIIGLNGISGNEGGTLSYRWQLWDAHISSLNNIEWIIGKSFGSGYNIQLENYTRDITPHNAYIHTIIRSGVIGLLAVVMFIINLIRACKKRKVEWGVAICCIILVFWYPYTYNFYTAIVLAFVIKSIR